MSALTAAVLTVSDSSFAKTRQDLSGPALRKALEGAGFTVTASDLVPDNRVEIENALIRMVDLARVVVTTGGTGIAERDVTPEATETVCDRMVPGIPEVMRREGLRKTPFSALSRAVCGIRGTTLILNVPGSPTAAVESLEAVLPLMRHAVDLLSGKTQHAQAEPA